MASHVPTHTPKKKENKKKEDIRILRRRKGARAGLGAPRNEHRRGIHFAVGGEHTDERGAIHNHVKHAHENENIREWAANGEEQGRGTRKENVKDNRC